MGALLPILVIVAIFAIVGVSGFGADGGAGDKINKKQVDREVSAALAGIPQHGRTLGSPRSPVTLQVFADLECPTVRRFVTKHLPGLIADWVRPGLVQLEYHSLETDTLNEHRFFRQEAATLAAGKQDKLWDFFLTFVREQGLEYSGYATEAFLSDIGSQIHGLDETLWRKDSADPALYERVALDLQAARHQDLTYTPSFLLAPTHPGATPAVLTSTDSLRRKVRASVAVVVAALRRESVQDNPALHELELADRKEIRELTGE